MLPLELIRKDPDRVRRAAALKREEAPIDEILELDREWRAHQNVAETIKAEQNRLSKEFAKSRDGQLKERLRDMAERAKTELKTLMPEDAKEAIGHGIRAKRSKSGAVSFDLVEMEARHASLQ